MEVEWDRVGEDLEDLLVQDEEEGEVWLTMDLRLEEVEDLPINT